MMRYNTYYKLRLGYCRTTHYDQYWHLPDWYRAGYGSGLLFLRSHITDEDFLVYLLFPRAWFGVGVF